MSSKLTLDGASRDAAPSQQSSCRTTQRLITKCTKSRCISFCARARSQNLSRRPNTLVVREPSLLSNLGLLGQLASSLSPSADAVLLPPPPMEPRPAPRLLRPVPAPRRRVLTTRRWRPVLPSEFRTAFVDRELPWLFQVRSSEARSLAGRNARAAWPALIGRQNEAGSRSKVAGVVVGSTRSPRCDHARRARRGQARDGSGTGTDTVKFNSTARKPALLAGRAALTCLFAAARRVVERALQNLMRDLH